MFVPSAVMNNNAAFYYIQRKHLFFTRDKGEGDSRPPASTVLHGGSVLRAVTPNSLCVNGRKEKESRFLPPDHNHNRLYKSQTLRTWHVCGWNACCGDALCCLVCSEEEKGGAGVYR